jgi:C-terminal processing protease CtpA/Prc
VEGTSFFFPDMLEPNPNKHYSGKIVVLINEDAISQSEHSCLWLEAATNVTFIGTPTSGVNGDVTDVVLPGNVDVRFSGQAIRHADGRQLQRIGIQPTIKVEATVEGIRHHRDEVLEAAVGFLEGKANATAQRKNR